jgi:hypothetical protein
VKDKLSPGVFFNDSLGRVRGQVLGSAVKGVYPRSSFLPIDLWVDAQLGSYLPREK